MDEMNAFELETFIKMNAFELEIFIKMVFEIMNGCKNLEEAKEKIKALLDR